MYLNLPNDLPEHGPILRKKHCAILGGRLVSWGIFSQRFIPFAVDQSRTAALQRRGYWSSVDEEKERGAFGLKSKRGRHSRQEPFDSISKPVNLVLVSKESISTMVNITLFELAEAAPSRPDSLL